MPNDVRWDNVSQGLALFLVLALKCDAGNLSALHVKDRAAAVARIDGGVHLDTEEMRPSMRIADVLDA